MKKLLTIIILLGFFSVSVASQETEIVQSVENESDSQKIEVPEDFKSDGCSLFPDGNYRDCCVVHDKDYYKGGSCKERSESDKRLYRCVKNKKGWYNKIVAPVMWIGVRIGGVSFLPTPFRWGFGKDRQKKAKKRKNKSKKIKKISKSKNKKIDK